MSIKDEGCNFYKKIWDSPNREEVMKVVKKLSSSARHYGNKVYPVPMLGLLLYNQQKLKRFAGRSAVEELASWNEQDLKILFGVHEQVRRLNEQCLAPLSTELPEALSGTNPYRDYPHSVSTEGFEELLFKLEDAEDVIRSFHAHPAFAVALSNLTKVKERPIDYDRSIWKINTEIVEAGPGGKVQWVKDYEEAENSDHPEIDIYHHLGALLSLYNSLSNLDQFIYHGLFRHNILQINRTHIVDYFWTTGGAGRSMWLMHIPFGYMYIFEPTDLITVNTDIPDRNPLGDRLCSIHTQSIPGTVMAPGILELRIIDDNLNAYHNLLRQ